MSRRTMAEAMADAAAGLVADGPPDVAGHLAFLLADLVDVVGGASAAGVLVRDEQQHLEVLVATSHKVEQLELFQRQHEAGPCVDAVVSGEPVDAVGKDELRARWGEVGEAIAADYASVHAAPMRWRGQTVGALNLLHPQADGITPDVRRTAQAFADVATLTLLSAEVADGSHLAGAVRRALAERVVLEQAKGVLAYRNRADMATAYTLMLDFARSNNLPLTAAARAVVEGAGRHLRD